MSYITIDKTKCKACYLCMSVCPKGLLKIGTEVNHLGEKLIKFDDPNNECLGCAMCATRCPDFAITGVFKE